MDQREILFSLLYPPGASTPVLAIASSSCDFMSHFCDSQVTEVGRRTGSRSRVLSYPCKLTLFAGTVKELNVQLFSPGLE